MEVALNFKYAATPPKLLNGIFLGKTDRAKSIATLTKKIENETFLEAKILPLITAAIKHNH